MYLSDYPVNLYFPRAKVCPGSTTTSFHMTYMTKVIGNDIDVVGRPKMVEIDYKIKNM